MIDMKPIENNM